MINGTCRNIVSDSSPGSFDNPIGSELAQPRTNIADWYTQVFGNFLCREAVGAAPQDLEDAIRKFRHYKFLESAPAPTRLLIFVEMAT
jgi:hypothetical protein